MNRIFISAICILSLVAFAGGGGPGTLEAKTLYKTGPVPANGTAMVEAFCEVESLPGNVGYINGPGILVETCAQQLVGDEYRGYLDVRDVSGVDNSAVL